jgi:2-polyprenyl-3-methyl-5-hydroxy-6-metoxy-1,4-benzoquinol methylase
MTTTRSKAPDPIAAIVASYSDVITRVYCRVRFVILRQTFLEEVGQYLPDKGRVLDIGCGFGLFSLYFASIRGDLEILGVDRNAERIQRAAESARKLGLENVSYRVADAQELELEGSYDAIYMLDLLHHLPRAEVPGFLAGVRSHLRAGGVLIVKEVEDRPAWKRWFTLALDRLMVGWEPIHYWSAKDMTQMLGELGFTVRMHRMKDFLPYPHVLYISHFRASR